MAWVALDKDEKERVSAQLPGGIDDLQKKVVASLHPEVIAAWMWPKADSKLPLAAICLGDATNVLMQIQHAFRELLSFRIWYLEHKEPANERAADYMSQFYADDVVLRLYAVVGHLESAILAMMETDVNAVKIFEKHGIGKNTLAYLNDRHQGTEITKIWSKVMSSREWNSIRKYRNRWVHDKPLIVRAWGHQFNRETRWKEIAPGTRQLSIGTAGDPPEWDVQELIETALSSVAHIIQATNNMVDYYLEVLEPFSSKSIFSIKVVSPKKDT